MSDKSTVEDKDSGMKAAIKQAERFGYELHVGTFRRKTATYGLIHEMRTQWMRGAFDREQPTIDAMLEDLADEIDADGDVRSVQDDIGEAYAEAQRASLHAEGLVDTGALVESIEVRERKRKKK